ncbi:hypothetical protein BGX30_004333 [Mortierella sp. GBA39]|nr:hypothetical protein BGX30_004333 [Mortierella sp. GBA39]
MVSNTIWDELVDIWELLVDVWDILIFPGYSWNLLCIVGSSVVAFLGQFIPWDQIPWDQIPWDQVGCVSKYIFMGVCLGALLVLIITIVPRALGFKEDGIEYRSIGSHMMAYHNGYTPSGGFVANMQSYGTRAGMSASSMAVGCLLGAGAVNVEMTRQCHTDARVRNNGDEDSFVADKVKAKLKSGVPLRRLCSEAAMSEKRKAVQSDGTMQRQRIIQPVKERNRHWNHEEDVLLEQLVRTHIDILQPVI